MECEGESEASAAKKRKYPPTEDELDRLATEQWLLWQEPSCNTILCKRQYAPCTCELGKFPTDDYPAFLASRGLDAKEFAADVAAVNEHVRRAIAVSFRLKDLRLLPVVLGLVTVIAWAAGVPGAYAFVIGFGTMAVLQMIFEIWHCACKFQQAVEEAVQRLLPKYEKIGVAIRREQQSYGSDGPEYNYLIFQVVQLDVEAPPGATSAGEVIVAGEIVRP